MSLGYLVGLDVGTTGAKALVSTAGGQTLAQGHARLDWQATRWGAETAAQAIFDAALEAVRRALRQAPAGPVAAIGIASFAESSVLLGDTGEPVGPVIAWHDRRDGDETARLGAEIGADTFSRVTGLPFRQQWSITKQRWVTDHLPEAGRVRLRMGVAEWIAHRLGARAVTEASFASRTGWLRLRERAWWPEALAWSGITAGVLPPLASAGEPLGTVCEAAGARLRGARITIAGQDHQSAAAGLGGIRPGDEVDSCGTADALLRTSAILDSDETVLALARAGVTVGWHAVAGAWCLLGGTEGGLMLRRSLRMLGLDDFTQGGLDEAAARLPASPIRATADGQGLITFAGIGDDASPAGIWRAAVDCAVEESLLLHERIAELAGPCRRLLVTGGWLASRTFAQGKARTLGDIETRTAQEAGARGAALYAAVAAGLADDVESAGTLLGTAGA